MSLSKKPTYKLDDFPNELLCTIFSFIESRDLLIAIPHVCSKFESVISENPYIFRCWLCKLSETAFNLGNASHKCNVGNMVVSYHKYIQTPKLTSILFQTPVPKFIIICPPCKKSHYNMECCRCKCQMYSKCILCMCGVGKEHCNHCEMNCLHVGCSGKKKCQFKLTLTLGVFLLLFVTYLIYKFF